MTEQKEKNVQNVFNNLPAWKILIHPKLLCVAEKLGYTRDMK